MVNEVKLSFHAMKFKASQVQIRMDLESSNLDVHVDYEVSFPHHRRTPTDQGRRKV